MRRKAVTQSHLLIGLCHNKYHEWEAVLLEKNAAPVGSGCKDFPGSLPASE
jgi:hypothetical protein